jgi:hypothetical protein
MRRQAYSDWKTMIDESVVQASVIRYLLKYDTYKVAESQIISEIGNGFYRMQGLVNLLYDYENNRMKYPDLESFMPVIIDFYDKIARESETMYEIKKYKRTPCKQYCQKRECPRRARPALRDPVLR